MNTTKHPAPVTGWFEQFTSQDGKVVASAFCDTNIGVSTTTQTHVLRRPDGKFEARVGFAIMGPPQMTDAEFEACGHNPFHPEFHDNYAEAVGDTTEEAITKLGAQLKSIGDSLWE